LLLAVFAALAWSAVLGKSPTMDEGYHAMAGWLHWREGDYRFDSEDPPLSNTLAASVVGSRDLHADLPQPNWARLPIDIDAEYRWQMQMLYRTPGNDGAAFVNHYRAVMLCIAVGMGAFLAAFVWRAAIAIGATPAAAGGAAVLSSALLALDPNFLAHAPLMKNDVASAFAMLVTVAATWSAGRALTPCRILALGIAWSMALTLKFTGPLLIMSSLALLILRALASWEWAAGGWRHGAGRVVSRIRRLAAAAMTIAIAASMAWGAIWASYDFRFAPAREPGAMMNMWAVEFNSLISIWEARHTAGDQTRPPSLKDLQAMPLPPAVSLVRWMNHRHLLPQAFLAGLLFAYQASQVRATFLCGHLRGIGTWWYFPFAMAVKTPLATLTAFASLAIFAFRRLIQDGSALAGSLSSVFSPTAWTALCLGLPAAIYFSAAMSTNLNLGIRHVLPVYPLLFAAVGLATARLWDARPTLTLVAGPVLIAALAIESCSAYPNYIPFFNAFAGGSRGGLRLLSDSNLDWGQDLPLLAAWQHDHPDVKLYLGYFGSADPAYYGIRYTNIDEGFADGPSPQPIVGPAVLAISATTLQGTYCRQVAGRPTWSTLWKLKPIDVLGGSIYLFHVPARPDDYLPPGESLID
jgi:hypothetical protein